MIRHTCPWWFGHVLASPVRRLFQNPRRIAAAFVREGMSVLEAGPGMGFFTVEIARLVGSSGCVHAVDLQQRMLDGTRRRLDRAGLGSRLTTSLCKPGSLGAGSSRFDLAFLFYMVHEVADREGFFGQVSDALVTGGMALYAEPVLHVPSRMFEEGIGIAAGAGLVVAGRPPISLSRAALLSRGPGSGNPVDPSGLLD